MSFKKFIRYVVLIVISTLLTLTILFWLTIGSLVFMAKAVGKGADEEASKPVSEHTYLELYLDYPVHERTGSPFNNFNPQTLRLEPSPTFGQLLDMIREAEKDPQIDGIVLRSNMPQTGWAQTVELRRALEHFKKSGKSIFAYLDEITPKNYILASVSDKIYFNNVGMADWKGLSMQLLFFKDFLDKLHIDVQVIRHGKYKSAVEPFMQNKMSEANRLQNKMLLTDLWTEMLRDAHAGRGLDTAGLNKAAARLRLCTPADLMRYKMVDTVFPVHALKQHIKDEDETTADIHFIDERKYFQKTKAKKLLNPLSKKLPQIAVLTAEGEIVPGEGKPDQIGETSLIKTIRKLRRSDKVKAVVLRIDSPGGSATASENIWNELKLLAAEKPLIISMGNVAASGGYYIAMAGEYIFAEPTTITGSIGVFGLVPNIRGLAENIGIHVDTVKTHPHADMGVFRPLDTLEKEYYQEMVEHAYGKFLLRVAENRGMDPARVDSLAQGRLWSGEDAFANALVDTLGGLREAIQLAEKKAKEKNPALKEKTFRIKFYPAPENPFAMLFGLDAETRLWWKTLRDLKKGKIFSGEWADEYNRLFLQEKIWMRMEYTPVIR
ncbi:MAG: signal peptide peptidase SppA [Chlorobi bacterium]|nr:signal peptide peptidase SppA [Chlorobiota bacterium]